jgi:hypothetical protein
MPPTRRLDDHAAATAPRETAEPPPPEPAVLSLQRAAGNAAVARLLARQPADAPVAAPDLRLPAGALDDWIAAGERAERYLDELIAEHRETLIVPGSVAEIVYQACEQEFTLKDGRKAKVRDKMKPPEVEQRLRERARSKGAQLSEHRDASDLPGMKSELDALLANLGAIPTSITIGNDQIKVVGSISGKVSAEASAGPFKIEGEGSSEGIEGSVKVGPVKGSFGPKTVKAEVKVGDLVTVSAGLDSKADGVAWKADIAIGTIGKLIMPEDVAKVFKGAQDTFSKSAGELVRHRDDPAKVKEHGGALAEAVTSAVEKAQKSAAQAKKPGWRIGGEIKGDPSGGVSGSVTLTWVW